VPFASTMPMRAPTVVSVSRLTPVLVLFSAEYASSMKPNSTRNRPPKMTPSTIAARLSNVDAPSRAEAACYHSDRAGTSAAVSFRGMLTSLVERVSGARGAVFCDHEGESVEVVIRDAALSEYEMRVVGAQLASVWVDLTASARERGAGAQIGTICVELQASTVARPGDDATPPGRFFHLQAVGIEQEGVAGIEVLRRMQVGERGLLRAGTVQSEHGQPGKVQGSDPLVEDRASGCGGDEDGHPRLRAPGRPPQPGGSGAGPDQRRPGNLIAAKARSRTAREPQRRSPPGTELPDVGRVVREAPAEKKALAGPVPDQASV